MRKMIHLPLLTILVCCMAFTTRTCQADDSGLGSPSDSETADYEKSISESATIAEPTDYRSAAAAPSNSAWPDLVAKVRPSVVLIRTPFGSGTGFVFGDGRWIVTNNHVIKNAPWDNKSGCQIVKVHFGNDVDGRFQLNPEAVWGKVSRVSLRMDLAVIEYQSLPSGLEPPPSLTLADTPPREGEDCFAIGMPSAGVLWTVRRGTVAGHGTYPGGFNNLFRLGSGEGFGEKRRDDLIKLLAPEGTREITLSTCGINPGDSGGPLVDTNGNLVAVTFAVPHDTSLKEFGYHIHLNEVRNFLDKGVISARRIEPPSSVSSIAKKCSVIWDPGKDFIQFIKSQNADGAPVAYYFDANGKSIAKVDPDDVLSFNQADLWKKCGIEWAVTHDKTPTYFFDTNTDGEIDLVFVVVGGRGNDACKFTRDQDGDWEMGPAKADFLDSEVVFERDQDQKKYQDARAKELSSLLRR